MTLQNRVTPTGDLIADPARGTLFGNRGRLHDDERRIVRRAQVRRWITCVLEFRGRHREPMPPGRYTGLFFLDEATALAAGHRPCAECRNADHRRYRDLFPGAATADTIDAVLARERRLVGGRRVTTAADGELPDGVMLLVDGAPWVVDGGGIRRWTPTGYTDAAPLPDRPAVLTPPSSVAVIRAGFPVTIAGLRTG